MARKGRKDEEMWGEDFQKCNLREGGGLDTKELM